MSTDNPITAALDQMVQTHAEGNLGGINTSLRAIAKAIAERPEDTKMAAFMDEVSAALADMVSAMEKDEDAGLAKALTDGLKALRIEVKSPQVILTPEINVNVSPTPIQNNVTVPGPVVHIMDRPGKKTVHRVDDITFGAGGFVKSMTITSTITSTN